MIRHLVFVLLPLAFVSGVAQSKKPNIIFILVDDMGYGDVGVFYQNQRQQANNRNEPWMVTPNLDRLAEGGALLTNHYCAAPVCAPSRASLLSGLSQGQANVRNNQFDKAIADSYTIGNVLQKAGYTTAAIGKWGLQGDGDPPNWTAHPLKRGFDYYYGYMRHRDGHEHYPKEGIYRNKAEVWENYKNVVGDLDKCYTGDLWTAVAKRWITQHHQQDKSKPFFLYLAYDTPHAALELPTQAYPDGGGVSGGMQWLNKPGNMITTANGEPDSWMDPIYENATWDDDNNSTTPEVPWPETYKRYATIITRIDHQIGDIMQLLRDLDLDMNTLVVFTSDNGPSQESYLPKGTIPNDPNFFNGFGPFDGIKRDVLEGGVREPTIVSWPGTIKPSQRIDQPSVFYDWLPTFASVAGFPPPAFSEGKSILPMLEGKSESSHAIYIEYFHNGKTPGYTVFDKSHRNRERGEMQLLRVGDTLAIRYNIQTANDDFEFYDITKDAQQINNLANDAAYKSRQTYFKQEVLKHRLQDTSATRPYDKEEILSMSDQKNNEAANWRFFNGHFPWLPKISELHPKESGRLTGSRIKLNKNDEGVVVITGFVKVDKGGQQTIQLKSKSSVLMKLYEINVINNAPEFSDNIMESRLSLGAGYHPFELYCYKEKGKQFILPEITISMNGEVHVKVVIGNL